MARAAVLAALRAAPPGRHERVVRVNGLRTPWGADDVGALLMACPDAILLPKVDAADDLATLAALVGGLASPPAIWAMIETPRGVLRVAEILEGPTRPAVAVVGTNDLLTDLRARTRPDRAPLLPHLTTCIAAARAGGVDILDGVFNDLADPDGFGRECADGRDLGFDGKTLIHPAQIAGANAAFAPSAAETAWARAVVAAFADPALGLRRVEGRMVERLHLATARRTLALLDALA